MIYIYLQGSFALFGTPDGGKTVDQNSTGYVSLKNFGELATNESLVHIKILFVPVIPSGRNRLPTADIASLESIG